MIQFAAPGVYKRDVFPTPPVELRTGVPAFLGYASGNGAVGRPTPIFSYVDFTATFGRPVSNSYLSFAVRAFFSNGGSLCYAVRLDDNLPPEIALQSGLDALIPLDTIDLVAAPDIMRLRQPGNLNPDPVQVGTMQASVVAHCQLMGDRFAILDPLPGGGVVAQLAALRSPNAAMYYPWVRMTSGPVLSGGLVPPSGHVAGVFASTDSQTGVHKAPANRALTDAVDVEIAIPRADQDRLNPIGVNCIRAFPGRGILVWGARTLSSDPAWTYVSTRRIFLTAGRWIARNLASFGFEPNNQALWTSVNRELNRYFTRLFENGALAGATPETSFYVKCDAETNPPGTRDLGMLVTEVGLAPGVPSEFIVVRIVQNAGGVSIGN